MPENIHPQATPSNSTEGTAAKPGYASAKSRAHRAILDMVEAPDRPSARATVELDILEMAMPHVFKHMHNAKYREDAVKEAADKNIATLYPQPDTRGVHGADAAITRDLIEIKTATFAGKSISPTTGLGMFDKTPARVDEAETLSALAIWNTLVTAVGTRAAREDVLGFLETGSPVFTAISGAPVNIGTPRRVARLVQRLDAAGVLKSTGLTHEAPPADQTIDWPPAVTLNGVARYKHTCFALFEPTSPRPLLVIHMPSAALESAMGDLFEAAAARVRTALAKDRTGKGASPRDSYDVRLGDVMRPGTGARIVAADFPRLAAKGIHFTGEAAAWASSRHNTFDRDMAERIAKDLCGSAREQAGVARPVAGKKARR